LDPVRASPFAIQRNTILGVLLASAAAAWLVLAWRASGAGMPMASPTMGMQAPLFLAVWTVMMIAMMFPAAAPMILTFHRVQAGKRERGDPFVATWVFVAGYMLVWTLSGVVAYAGAVGAESLAAHADLSVPTIARIGGGILLVAGSYQLTPLKDRCLSKCRTPMTFIVTAWRDGVRGALRMGLEHGIFCLGCCWLLFVLLFPLGVMNLAATAAVTALLFAEKTFPAGRRIAMAAGVSLMVYGAVVLAAPEALPTLGGGNGMAMPMPMPMPMPGPMPGTSG
jgi:predicted metal-binding membrane protein